MTDPHPHQNLVDTGIFTEQEQDMTNWEGEGVDGLYQNEHNSHQPAGIVLTESVNCLVSLTA